VLLGNGDGTFQPQVTYAVGGGPAAIAAGDFTGSGRVDLAVANGSFNTGNTVSVLLGNGDETCSPPGQSDITALANPVVADVTGDGTDDVLVVYGAGDILYRQGIAGQPGTFEPPVIVNPPLPDGSNPYTSRDIVWVPDTDQGPLLASVDAQKNAITFYAYRDGRFVRLSGSLATGEFPAQIIAADLNGFGREDLIVRNAGDGSLSVFWGDTFTGPGSPGPDVPLFQASSPISVGPGVSDVAAVDTTGDGRLDLVVTNKVTGQMSVLLNLGNGSFAAPVPYRAGTGLSAIDPAGTPEVTSLEATAGVAGGPLTPGAPADLVTINAGSSTMDVLAGRGDGTFAYPITIDTPGPPQIIRMADFTGSSIEDLAVLTADGLSVYLGNGQGGFLPPTTYAVPPEADGLTVADLLGNGKLDLLVGDAYGDVLVLIGNGDGTFEPYRQANKTVELAVAALTGKGSKDVIYADQGLDRVVVDYGAGNSAVLGNQSTGLLAPGAVALADLTGNGILDLIVANSGSNNVLIYPGLGNGQFGPAVNGGHGYFVGTNPVGITVANLTGSLPDLVVADKGSNQVSILLNQGGFRFTDGARLNSWGDGPVSTVVGHFTGSAYPDLLVTNSASNDVALLPGRGQGFFNDQTQPQTFAVGSEPGPTFVGTFDGRTDLVTVNTGSNDLTLISDFLSADAVTHTISSGGTDPFTAFSFEASSGFDDLVVGNAGDGVLALFEGSANGLNLSSTETMPDLPSPSALVYAGLAGGQVQFYAANEGREAAILVALSLTGESGLPGPAGTGAGTGAITPSIPENVAQLVALSESSLALVGSLLVVTVESPAAELTFGSAEIESATSNGALAAGPGAGALGQSVLSQSGPNLGESVGGQAAGEPAQPPATATTTTAPPSTTSWQRFVLGIDEALERYNREHQELSSPRRDDSPGAGASASPAGGQGEARTLVPENDVTGQRAQPARRLPWEESVDRAIEVLQNQRAGTGQPRDAVIWRGALRVKTVLALGDEPSMAPTILRSPSAVRLSEAAEVATSGSEGAGLSSTWQSARPHADYSVALALGATVVRGMYVPVHRGRGDEAMKRLSINHWALRSIRNQRAHNWLMIALSEDY
jgi:hypothetical protein